MEIVTLSDDFMADFYKEHPEFVGVMDSVDWCECEGLDENPTFYENNKHKNCVEKHHYHCSTCGKISQVG